MEQPRTSGAETRCGTSTCVAVERIDGGVALTSTIGADKGRVVYTDGEWSQFVSDVKAGAWDSTVREAVSA